MKWTRATVATLCGGCRTTIRPGRAILVLELAAVKAGRRVKVRCEDCAGHAPPPELPPMILTTAPGPPLTMARFAPGMLPITFKRDQDH